MRILVQSIQASALLAGIDEHCLPYGASERGALSLQGAQTRGTLNPYLSRLPTKIPR
jgi:hypothetical protein